MNRQQSVNSDAASLGVADCACYNTRRAARLLAKAYDRALQPSGLTNTQFSALAVIRAAPVSPTISALAETLSVDRTTLTRNLNVMVRDGLVRLARGRDARSKIVTITGAGHDALGVALPHWERVQRLIAAHLPDWPRLKRDIETLTEVARSAP